MPEHKNNKQRKNVYKIVETDQFGKWMKKLKNDDVRQRLHALIARLRESGIGDTKSVGDRVSELRDHQYGYRIYFTVRDKIIVILLAGGHKDSQKSDIVKAKEIERELNEDNAI